MKYSKKQRYAVVERDEMYYVFGSYAVFTTIDKTALPPQHRVGAWNETERIAATISAIQNAITVPVDPIYTFRCLKLAAAGSLASQGIIKIACTPRWLKIESSDSMDVPLWQSETPKLEEINGYWFAPNILKVITKTPETLEIGITPLYGIHKLLLMKTEEGTYGIVNCLPPKIAAQKGL